MNAEPQAHRGGIVAESPQETPPPSSAAAAGGAHDEHERLGQRLREAREYLGLSQEFVAEQLGIPRASVSAMEAGKRKVSGLELKQLARLYKRPVGEFLREEAAGEAQGAEAQDETIRALFRTTRTLSDQDRQQVLRFAKFLRQAGRAPVPPGAGGEDR